MPKQSIYLVSCVSKKRPYECPAEKLYTSTWFAKAREFVLKSSSPWFILSAQHGLVHPEQILAPYEKTLNDMGVAERKLWAEHVKQQMESDLPKADRIILLAGVHYRRFLEPWLRHRFDEVSVPMKGLQIGKQLQWLSRNEPD